MRPRLYGGCCVRGAKYRRSWAHTAPQAMAPVPKNRAGAQKAAYPWAATHARLAAGGGQKWAAGGALRDGGQESDPKSAIPTSPAPCPPRGALWRVCHACREPPCPGAAWPAGAGLQGRAHRLAPRGAGGGGPGILDSGASLALTSGTAGERAALARTAAPPGGAAATRRGKARLRGLGRQGHQGRAPLPPGPQGAGGADAREAGSQRRTKASRMVNKCGRRA